jgi:hypothetical protein
MYYYLVNYKTYTNSFVAKHSRIAISLIGNLNINLLKSCIAEKKHIAEPLVKIEIEDYKQVTEDVFRLICPFVNGSIDTAN